MSDKFEQLLNVYHTVSYCRSEEKLDKARQDCIAHVRALEARIARLRNAVVAVATGVAAHECSCSFAQRLNGDGCARCNPTKYAEILIDAAIGESND